MSDKLSEPEKAELKRRMKEKEVSKLWNGNIGKEVEIYCARAPRVHGTVKKVDIRYGNIFIENEDEIIQVAMSSIVQVRFPKA